MIRLIELIKALDHLELLWIECQYKRLTQIKTPNHETNN
jgi:hypothetical protein